jgi:tetratricopeptide (TPR) repeat protein
LLDAESHPESRLLAVPEIEEFLTTPEVASFIRARLFVAPMPENTDLIGAINRAHGHGAARLVAILEEAGAHQDEIARCRASWDAVPAQTFRDEPSKEAVAFALVQAGAFHQLVTTPAERRGTFLVKLLSQPQFQQWRVGLTSWINPISAKNRATNRAVEEEEETRSTRRRPRPSKIQLPAEARLDVVSLQKNAVRKALTTGDLNQARAFCEDLVAHQERSSRPEHIAKSLCDLAQAAKDLGFHELQLEWMKKATDFAPGDGWSLAQLGDAYRCLGQWAQAERAFALALQHGAVSIARNGRAEALKGMGRLEDAFREYDAAVKEFPEDVFARNGRAEVLKGMGRLEDAFREYDATVKEFPQDVVARNGRAEVLKGMGRLEDAFREYETIAKEFPQDAFARNGAASVCVLKGEYDSAAKWIGPLVDSGPPNWVGLHIVGMIRLRTGDTAKAVELFERGLRDGPFEDRPFFRSGLAYARLLSREIHQAAEILEGEASVVSKVLQIHIYGDLDQTERARQAYDIVRSNRNPQVIELTAELAARARLESRPRTRSDQWIQEREFELLMAA